MIRTTRASSWFAGFLAIGLTLGLSTQADAQWAPDRAYTEGPGIRLGNLELHPGVAVRGGYDSNVFRTKNNTKGAAILGVTPHLHLSTLKALRLSQGEDAAGAPGQLPAPVAFDLGASATFFKYFESQAPSNVEADTSANLSILPERTFGFDVGAGYMRSTRPFTDAGGVRQGFFASNPYAFDRITPNLTLRGQSRGGVIKGTLGYSPGILLYERNPFKYLNAYTHAVPATFAWKFLPYTALLYDANVAFLRYSANNPNAQTGASIFLSDANRFQSRIGINGAVTTKFSMRALVGYAGVFLQKDVLDDKQTPIGEAAATYSWVPGSSAEVGYVRSLELSPLGGFMQMDRGYAKTSMLFAQVFQLSVDAGVAHVNYGRLLAPGPNGNGIAADGSPVALGAGNKDERKDVRVDGGIHGEYRATNWLAVMADLTVLANLTNFEYLRGTATPFPAQFVTVQAYGGVRLHY